MTLLACTMEKNNGEKRRKEKKRVQSLFVDHIKRRVKVDKKIDYERMEEGNELKRFE